MDRAMIRAFVLLLALSPLFSGCNPGKAGVTGTVGITVLEEEWLSSIEVWTSGPSMRNSQLEPTAGHRFLRILFQLDRPVVGGLDLTGLVLRSRSNAEVSTKVRAIRIGVPKSVKYRISENNAPGNVWRDAELGFMALLQSDVLMLLSNPGGPYSIVVLAPDGDTSESARGPLAVDAVFEIPSGAKGLELLLDEQ